MTSGKKMKNISLLKWIKRKKAPQDTPLSEVILTPVIRENIKVLVVDDSKTQLYAIKKMLQRDGDHVLTAEDGRQGILMARQHQPDIILMDIVMPKINGFQATRYLSRQDDTCHIPIIIVSGSDQGSDKAWGLKLGAKAFINKPVKKETLLEQISMLVSTDKKQKPVRHSSVDEYVQAG